MTKSISYKNLKKAKKDALREAKRLSKGKPDRVRHRIFVALWEGKLNSIITES